MDGDQSNDNGGSGSAESINPDLGSKDIRFLSAIQEVNAREGYQPGTQERPPATTSEIGAVGDLNKSEVNYRFNQRGFDEDGLGYITVYGAQLLENGALSSKSAELTEKGEAALAEVLEEPTSGHAGNGDSDLEDRLAELEAEVTELREENEALRETVEQFENSETGAWSIDREERFDATLNAMIAYQRIFNEVFGIDVSDFRGDSELPDKAVAEARQRLRETAVER